jgi:hypothetical protein
MEILQLLCSCHFPLADTNLPHSSLLYSLGTDDIENSISHSSSIVAGGFVAMGICLFVKVILSNGSCIFPCPVVVAQQWIYMLQYLF